MAIMGILEELLKDYQPETDDYIDELIDEYQDELEGYEYVENINEIALGGFLKYFTLHGEYRAGGIIVKFTDGRLILKNSNHVWSIKPDKNYLFYKPNRRGSDFRKIICDYLKDSE